MQQNHLSYVLFTNISLKRFNEFPGHFSVLIRWVYLILPLQMVV
jgi:hypothetical protein